MAIDKGIAISCDDLQQIGGIKHILLRIHIYIYTRKNAH